MLTRAIAEDPHNLEEAAGVVRVRAGDEGRPQVGPQEDHAPSGLLVLIYMEGGVGEYVAGPMAGGDTDTYTETKRLFVRTSWSGR